MGDLPTLVEFTSQEAMEAEGSAKAPERLEKGILAALEDDTLAMYWVLVHPSGEAMGSISALTEWSDWNAGFYWWIQSMYIVPGQRGKGYMTQLLNAVKSEMQKQDGLELRLYVHRDNKKAIRAYEKAAFERSPYEIMVLSQKPEKKGSSCN